MFPVGNLAALRVYPDELGLYQVGDCSLLPSAAPLEPHRVPPFAVVCRDTTMPALLALKGK